ncbi:MAG: hypothetical protein SF339_00805 [Blastocatellia bacterium]|nr:hypothetical protein [Blastocatellia bacterium]
MSPAGKFICSETVIGRCWKQIQMCKKSTLIAPIRVHAIYLSQGRAVVGAEFDFESLPYYDARRAQDVNPNLPYLAESVIAPPFADANHILEAGVHLHWDFPSFLRRTKYRADKPTDFPAVPTRWLVSRYAPDGRAPDRQWVVESDALLYGAALPYDMARTSVDVDIYSGEQPYACVGHSDALAAWRQRAGRLANDFSAWKEMNGGRPLTALGWGTPSFDSFYPNCRGVFGFHDPAGTRDHRYRVVGWYDDLDDDYWLAYLRLRRDDWGLREIDALTHLDDAHRRTLKRERIAGLLRDDLGITLPDAALGGEDVTDPAQWQRMVCCGEAQWLEEVRFDPDQTRYALGNTPTEALSALIAETIAREKGEVERQKLEDSLAAMLMGDRLKSLKLDIGPKFREFRHADEFVGGDGGVQWVVEKVDDNPTKQPPGEHKDEQRPATPLPEDLFPLLNDLNETQRRYDATARELESRQFQLYTDWYRYMHASYPPPGETEEYVEVSDLLVAIERGSLAAVKKLKWMLGEPGDEKARATGLAADVSKARAALEGALNRLNQEVKSDPGIVESFHWEVQRRAAPRFWQPAPPALVVALPRSGRTQEGNEDVALQPALACRMFSEALAFTGGPDFTLDALLTADEVDWKLPETALSTDLPIFRGEWQAEVFPAATMHPVTCSSGLYDPRFVLNNYLLGENEPDLDDHPDLTSPLALTKAGGVYTGSTYVNQKLDDRYRAMLRRFRELQEARRKTLQSGLEKTDTPQIQQEMAGLTSVLENAAKAERFLDDHDLLVVTLNGFNAALLQRHESIQLNPADPLGFAENKAFAREVAEALRGGFKGVSPDPHAPFMPIRSGALRLMTLRLVDLFGCFTDLTPSDVATALPMEVPDHGDWVRLPPRLAQPARWNFRFLQAAASDASIESQTHNSSSPVHGWVVPDLLDGSLDFFDPAGRRLGAVRTRGMRSDWDGAGLETLPPRLRQIVEWLLMADQETTQAATPHHAGRSGDDIHFLDEFMDDIEEAMDNIHPDDREGQSAFSVIMGRPMAVVQLGVELELKGLPAVNNSWSALLKAVRPGQAAAQASTDGFDAVRFHYRLGEYRQRNDGLIGYWAIEQDGSLAQAFSVNDSISAAIVRDRVQEQQDAYAARAARDAGRPDRQWLDVKNEEWRLHDPQGRTLFEFLLAEENGMVRKQDIIQPYIREGSRVWDALVDRACLLEETPFRRIRHYAEASNLSISAADPMQQHVALLDPHGVIHLTSGIQPVKAIQLPDRFIQDALARIELSFLTAPVLTPESELHLSLHKERAYGWTWREANRWPSADAAGPPAAETEIAEPDIKSFQTAAIFPERFVLREGQLALTHRTGQPTDDSQEQ